MNYKSNVADQISLISGIPVEIILSIVNNSKEEYKKVEAVIKSKFRLFYIPSPQLMLIQSYIIDIVLNDFEISTNSHAYVKGKSIKTNVDSHKGNRYFYQTDISSFFPSITSEMINAKISSNLMLNEADLNFVINAVAPYGHLDLGSKTSPVISNIVMFEFDQVLTDRLSKISNSITFSRYSDDITISSPLLVTGVNEAVALTMEEFGFKMNKSKTKEVKIIDKVKITGLFLYADGKVTVGTKFKKNLKHHLYLINAGKKSSLENNQVMEMMSFVRDIEPEFYQSLILKYSTEKESIIDTLLEKSSKGIGSN